MKIGVFPSWIKKSFAVTIFTTVFDEIIALFCTLQIILQFRIEFIYIKVLNFIEGL